MTTTKETNGEATPTLPPYPPCRKSNSQTFKHQAVLPRLPVPTLEETLEKFPSVVSSLQDAAQKEMTKRAVKEFLEGDGPKLQELLIEYDNAGKFGSYVEEFWTEAYLAPDCSTVLNLNPFFVLEDGPDAKIASDQILRAASLTFAAVKMASMLKREEIPADIFHGSPLCMDQFKSLFGSGRQPKVNESDTVVVDPTSTHIVVIYKNQFYYFRALWPDGAAAVDENDIAEILSAIRKDADRINLETSCKNAIGVLTALPRKAWAIARSNIEKTSAHNKSALELIDSALFVLALDDFSPRDINEAASNMLHGSCKLDRIEDKYYQAGTCCNRWYDKLQIIVCADGTAGINFEHSAVDGHTALRFVSDIFAETVVNFAQSITQSIYGKGRIPSVINAEVRRGIDTSPKKLAFDLPLTLLDTIFHAETAISDQIVSTETVVLEFHSYGKDLVKANKISPDSFVQMSMLLAYYRLYGKVVCAYEPVLTKHYYHGRTEAMRTSTEKAAAFCRKWCNHFSTREEKLQALKEATVEHSRLVKECLKGKGVDRHLFALKCIAEKNNLPVPPFFESESWKTLNHTVLSTSNCGNPSLRHFGFGPVVPDGFGIGYIIKDGGLQYSVSSKQRQTQRYVHTLEQTLLELGKILKQSTSVCVETHKRVVQRSNSALEYLDGIDYWGEMGDAAPAPVPASTLQSNDLAASNLATKFLARVVRRDSSVSLDIGEEFVHLAVATNGNRKQSIDENRFS